MDTGNIIAVIDAEVVRLKKARAILAGVTNTETLAAVAEGKPVAAKPAKRKLSAAARAKIAKAQKARWARVRKEKKAA